ncbi:hypothetical protein [Thiothrix subterranea]|uniref:hypothetical protein n=1 Tax=Thiothrix subterranea TaxID=2735563 RepID=UPI00280C1DE1|nr:hypothetical protein [Thiothrix subterranea]
MTEISAQAVSRESFSRRIWLKTLQGVGVKFGLAWVGVLIFMGVFAPFLANSMPLLMSKDGVVSAPVLAYLTAEDALVLAMFALALLLAWLRLSGGRRIVFFIAGTLLAALFANWLVQPPAVKIYDEFRTPAYTDVDWRIMPPVPYAPTDYLRDYPEHGLEAPLASTERLHLMGSRGKWRGCVQSYDSCVADCVEHWADCDRHCVGDWGDFRRVNGLFFWRGRYAWNAFGGNF